MHDDSLYIYSNGLATYEVRKSEVGGNDSLRFSVMF
jgi:hypothetical protein